MSASIKAALIEQVDRLNGMDMDQLLERRYKRLMGYGISH